jgi:hypothetical protein
MRSQATDSVGGNGSNCWNMAHEADLLEYYETMYRPLSNFGTPLSEGSLSALLEPIESNTQHVRMAMHSSLTAYVLLLREAGRFHPVASIDVLVEQATHRFAELAVIDEDGNSEGRTDDRLERL